MKSFSLTELIADAKEFGAAFLTAHLPVYALQEHMYEKKLSWNKKWDVYNYTPNHATQAGKLLGTLAVGAELIYMSYMASQGQPEYFALPILSNFGVNTYRKQLENTPLVYFEEKNKTKQEPLQFNSIDWEVNGKKIDLPVITPIGDIGAYMRAIRQGIEEMAKEAGTEKDTSICNINE